METDEIRFRSALVHEQLLKQSQMFYQLFFLHLAAGTVSFILDVSSAQILLFNSSILGSAVSQTVPVCDWSYAVNPPPPPLISRRTAELTVNPRVRVNPNPNRLNQHHVTT